MAKKPLLMGAEVEFSMSSLQPESRGRREIFHNQLLDAIRAEHGWLPDVRTPTGIYLDNGSRYYLDSGMHNEFSSPELSTPRQVAIYDRAAEQILLGAKAVVMAQRDGPDLCITKNNVNFSMPDRAAWGQHEAFTCWIPLETAAIQLIPHLVSRIPYAGAGCLSADPRGMGFELSQRARHMTRPTGAETTRDRAIFCTRAFPGRDMTGAGWTRTNLISKDSQRCSFGMYLSYGVTGLLFSIANQGHRLGKRMQLADPVAAMRNFSLDPWLRVRVPLASGRLVTAIDIQRAYLREARPHVESGAYPEWTYEVLEHWSTTLDQLESNPLQLASRLDTYLKLMIFERQLARSGLDWPSLHMALQVLDQMRRATPEAIVRAVLSGNPAGLEGKAKAVYDELAHSKMVKQVGFEPLRFAVRLQAHELHYHELGGLFDQLATTGQVDPVVVTSEEVQHAMHHPPGGRAEARSRCIRELSGNTEWVCDWQSVTHPSSAQWYDMRDPFAASYEVGPMSTVEEDAVAPSRMAELLARLHR